MTLKRNTALAGVPFNNARARGVILASDLGAVSADQAFVFEKITNINADGGGGAPPTNTGHNHSEAGNILYWALATQHFKITLFEVPGTTPDETDLVLLALPIFVPRGWENLPFIVLLDADAPDANLRLKDSSLAVLSGYERAPFNSARTQDRAAEMVAAMGGDNGSLYAVTFSVASAGLYVVEVLTSFTGDSASIRKFRSIAVMPYASRTARGRMTDAQWVVRGSDNVIVGDSRLANLWHPVDDAIVRDDEPMGPVAIINARNSNLLTEMATSQPAAGNAGLTVSKGHDHSEAGAYGVGIEYAIGAWCFGPISASDYIYGLHAPNPIANPAAFVIVTYGQVRTPVSANNSSGASKLKCALLVFSDTSKGDRGVIKVTIGGTPVTYTAATAGTDTYQLLTSASAFAFTSGGYTTVQIEAKDNGIASGGGSVRLLGYCLYFDQ